MAGLWDQLDDVDTHLIVAAIKGVASGIFSGASALAAINEKMASDNVGPLTTASETDLNAIVANVTGNAISQLSYVVGRVEPAMIAAANRDHITYGETAWRNDLSI